MNKIIFIIFLFSAPLFSQWFQQNSGTSKYLFSVLFIDSQTGYTAGDSCTLLKTTDGGENWFALNTGLSVIMFNDIYFTSNQTGWVCADDGIIIKTTNEGVNWSIQNTGISYDIWSIYFVSQSTGWAAGSVILKTTNSGTNWFHQPGTGPGMETVYFLSNDTGFAGGFYSSIYKTTNSGINWFMVNGEVFPHRYVLSFSFPSNNLGWTAGDGVILNSTNSGENWSIQWQAPPAFTIHFANELTGWCAGYGFNSAGGIYKTTNSGINWVEQFSIDSFNFHSSFFINANTGWVVGFRGVIFKTTNGGEPIGIRHINHQVPNSFKLYQNYPNPFNPITKIKFEIPHTPLSSIGEGPGVRLVIYDILGREITVLVNENLKPGTYEADWDASNFSSGIYFYSLITKDFTETNKMVLMK